MQPLWARASWLGCSLLLAAGPGAAEPVTVQNAGFEDLYFGSNLPPEYGGDVPVGAFPVGPPPPGWTAYYEGGSPIGGAFVGVLDPGTAEDHAPNPAFFPDGAPEGDNALLLYMEGDGGGAEFGVEQVLGATLEADTVYTLHVSVGNIASGAGLVEPFTAYFDLDGFPGYRIQLLAGGQVIAEDADSFSPSEGVFGTSVMAVVSSSHPQIGQLLAIRLLSRNQPDVPGVSGLEVDFDDVRLEALPITGVSIPALTPVAAALGLAAIGCARLRRCARPAPRS